MQPIPAEIKVGVRCQASRREGTFREIPPGIPMINIQVGREVGKIAKRVVRKKPCLLLG